VTPYSVGAMDRALTGVLVSAIRQAGADYNRTTAPNRCSQRMQLVQNAHWPHCRCARQKPERAEPQLQALSSERCSSGSTLGVTAPFG
jgi:hypothetical protein